MKALLIGTVVVGLAACKSTGPALVVSSTSALVDDRIEIGVRGLEPDMLFDVQSVTRDQRERDWIARATFVADESGLADLSRLKPEAGSSYEQPDAMGLFWSAEATVDGAQFAHRSGYSYPTRLELIVDGMVVDSTTIVRRFDTTAVVREEVREASLTAVYYRPSGEAVYPGVVVFAGSDGGIASAEWRASMLASRGFAALGVAFFNYDGRPADLVEIPIEYASGAVGWLELRDEVGKIGVLGFSKGSELALNLAARDSRVSAVVAISGTAYVWPGISDGPPETRSSWTWRGTPLPMIPWSVGPRAGAMFGAGPPFRLRLLYEESLAAATQETIDAARIPITDFNGAVLLVTGGEDGSWPASEMAHEIFEASRANPNLEVVHLDYPEAGHLILWDYLPAAGAERNAGQIFGGTMGPNARARADSWPRIQEFLRNNLRAD